MYIYTNNDSIRKRSPKAQKIRLGLATVTERKPLDRRLATGWKCETVGI